MLVASRTRIDLHSRIIQEGIGKFSYFHRRNVDVIVIQETHSLQTDELFWKNEWRGSACFSHGTNDSCGVCVLLKPSLNVEVVKSKTHNLGRYILLDIWLSGQCITLVGIYGPNSDNPLF